MNSLNYARKGVSRALALNIAKEVEQDPSLECIDLSSNPNLCDDNAAHILKPMAQCHDLKFLNMSMTKIGERAAEQLTQVLINCDQLSELNLSNNYLNATAAGFLAEGLKFNKGLKWLNLNVNNIKSAGLAVLLDSVGENQCIETLYVENCAIDSQGENIFKGLSKNRSLKYLSLYSNSIGDSAGNLFSALSVNQGLAFLNLENNQITNAVFPLLSVCLKQNKTLTELNLSMNSIGRKNIEIFADSLLENTALARLSMNRCELSNHSFIAVMGTIARQNYLSGFSCRENELSSDALCKLSEQPINFSCLESLDLSKNNLGDRGLSYMLFLLQKMPRLSALSLESCGITDQCLPQLIDYLTHSPHQLRAIDLSNNHLGDKGVATVADFLATNPPIQRFVLDAEDITNKGLSALARALKDNTYILYLGSGGIGHKKHSEALKIKELLARNKESYELRLLEQELEALGDD